MSSGLLFFVPALFPSLLLVSFLPMSSGSPISLQPLLRTVMLFSSIHKEKASLPILPSPVTCILSLSHSDAESHATWYGFPTNLMQIASWLDADCNVIWRRLRHDLRQVGGWYGTDWNAICCKSRGEAYVLYLWCGDFVVLFFID